MNLTKKNVEQYILWALLSIAVGFLTALMSQLPGDDPINWRVVATAVVASILAVLTSLLKMMSLPKVGTEETAVQVKHLENSGVPVNRMVVSDAESIALAHGAVRHAVRTEEGVRDQNYPIDHSYSSRQ